MVVIDWCFICARTMGIGETMTIPFLSCDITMEFWSLVFCMVGVIW